MGPYDFVGQAIRARREALGLRQEEIERRTGGAVSQTALSKIELGKTRRPNGEAVTRIAKALETTSDALWADVKPPAIADETELRSRADFQHHTLETALDQIDALAKAVVLLAGERGVSADTRREIQSLLASRKAG